MYTTPVSRRRFVAAAASTAAVAFLPSITSVAETNRKPKGKAYLMDLTRSKHAKLRTLPLDMVTITGGFWGNRINVNRTACIPAVYQQETENGRVLNFQRISGKDPATLSTDLHSLRHGADSEVYKWIEGASWALVTPDSAAQARMQQVSRDVINAQEPSGYLDTYFVGDRVPERMLPETQVVGHEIYSMGHLLQAGLASYRVTGDRRLLDAGLRFVNDYVLASFGPEAVKKPLISGHPGPEMMLAELYRETGDERYLKLTEYLLHGDSRIPLRHDQATYLFAGIPFTGRKVMEGHAVRAVYACCGAADYAIETGDAKYTHTLNLLWNDMTERQMYVTGGIGATIKDEAFGGDYNLPNEGSYCESCANIGVAQLAQRMLALTGGAKFGDTLEQALYNSVNSGMALDGRSFNYRNPLQHNPTSDPQVRRPFWYVNCCPPNLARTFSSLQSLFYSTSEQGIHVHLYNDSEMKWHLDDGTPITLTQKTNYPWDGNIQVSVQSAQTKEFTLFLRIPAWSATANATVNSVSVGPVQPGEYLAIRRSWSKSDKVELTLDMSPLLLTADPRIETDRKRVAIQRGPLVYCMEGLDQPEVQSLDQFAVLLNANTVKDIRAHFKADTLGGIVTLDIPGTMSARTPPTPGTLIYNPVNLALGQRTPVSLRLIPYYAFANRADTTMQVWLPYIETEG
jgi:DUF1680 family protein